MALVGMGMAVAPASHAAYMNALVVPTCGQQALTVGTQAQIGADPQGDLCVSIPVLPFNFPTSQTGAAVTTHLTFQTALAADTNRRGCTITNTSRDVELVFFGSNASATVSNALPIDAGGQVNCFDGSSLGNDNVAITSKTLDGATYVVTSR